MSKNIKAYQVNSGDGNGLGDADAASVLARA